MTTVGLAMAAAAEELVGCPFKFRGRNTQTGLDCLGVVIASLEAVGRPVSPPRDYALRNLAFEPFAAAVRGAGLVDVTQPICAGDVLLLRPSAAQFHAGVIGASGSLIHAHCGLRRVVTTPLPLPWPIERHWRLRAN